MRAALAIARKDLLLELRGREVVVSLFVFAFLVLTLFALSAEPGSTHLVRLAPGILWVTLLFAGVLGINRAFDRERENECFRGLLLSPCDPAQVYWGKILSTVAFLIAFETALWPLFAVLYDFPITRGAAWVWSAFLLGDLGFAALGVLLASATLHARGREVVLPLLLLPLCLPILVAGVKAVTVVLDPGAGAGNWVEVSPWLGRLLAFDAIFVAIGSVLFPLVVEE